MTNLEKQQVAIVTGANSGLGLALARGLASIGVPTLMIARRAPDLKDSASHIIADYPDTELFTISADVGSADDVQKIVRFMEENALTAKWLINNAGAGRFGEIGTYTANDIQEILRGNLVGTINMSQAFLKQLIENEGVLCNVMSTAALNFRPRESVYTAAKWGAKAFTETIRAELKGKPVKVMAVYPGGMDTPFWDSSRDYVPDSSKFMDPRFVAERLLSNIFDATGCQVSDITINRL